MMGITFIFILVVIIFSGIGLIIYQSYTSEYKYTADIPCYDKYGNEIVNLSCEKEVNCGWGQSYDNDDMQSYPCDKNEYKGKFANVSGEEQ